MTSNPNGESTSPLAGRVPRPKLRQATFILPKSGERVKRTVTLRSAGFDGTVGNGSSDPGTPLLNGRKSSHPGTGRLQQELDNATSIFLAARSFASSRTAQGVFKCSLAYLIGSLATFVPPIAAFLGQQDGKHMVATITVYFHPARSQGSMFEAVLLAVLAFIYAVIICFSSMGVSIFFGQKLGLISVGHIIVLVVFCGGGLGFVGWTKQRLSNPLVNIACSLTSLAIITVLTKEGAIQAAVFSNEKVIQVLKMIAMGVTATTAVSFLINPVSARKDLCENMIEVTDCFGEILAAITRSFLSGVKEELQDPIYLNTSNRYRMVFASLSRNLKDAKYEHYVAGTEREYRLKVKLVNCMQRLAQNIGGLRSAATTQFALLGQSPSLEQEPLNVALTPSTIGWPSVNGKSTSPQEELGGLAAIHEAPEDDEAAESQSTKTLPSPTPSKESFRPMNTPAQVFSRFIMHLGPSMKSLAFTLKQILNDLPMARPDYQITFDTNLRSSLVQAVDLYGNAREEALALIYNNQELNRVQPMEVKADFEEVAASCGHFSFSLKDFAQEMQAYLDILDELKLECEKRPRKRSWNWLKVWRRIQKTRKEHLHNDPERDNLINHHEDSLPSDGVAGPMESQGFSSFNKSDCPSSPVYQIYNTLRIFRRDDTKFAIKVGVGAALYALPSFIVSSRPFYGHWRGEWGLLSYMLVCSMTIGGSNTTSISRFFGTCLGAICAVLFWTISRGNAYALAFLGWLMSLWTSYLIIALGKGPMGRFIILTYNLSALYAYSLSVKDGDHDDDEGGLDPVITEIAFHRVVAVLSGCLWGLFITRFIWPISARQKFRSGLSLLWLRMGLVWKRDPLAILLDGKASHPYMDLREEFELHRYLTRLENLQVSASSEFELRGPFHSEAASNMLKSTGRMLDAFHAMNVVILKDPKASNGLVEILKATATERAQLGSRICFLFQALFLERSISSLANSFTEVLASSMQLQYPLSDALPKTDHARDRLLAKVFEYRRNLNSGFGTNDKNFSLLYASALVTGQLSEEIYKVVQVIEGVYGVLNEELLKLE